MNFITVENSGPLLAGSNYWSSELCAAGYYYLSPNAGALRLLVPASRENEIAEMLTGREVVATAGDHKQHCRRMIELLFDDHSANPFCLHLSLDQIEREFRDAGDLPRRFLIYVASPEIGKGLLAGELVWFYREADLPCMRPLL